MTEQPERQVVGVVPDELDPTYAQVEFNDGTMETMPTSQAEALPQQPPAPAEGPVQLDPLVDPNAPNPVAAAWEAAGQDPVVQFNERGLARPGYTAPEGTPTNPGVSGAGMPGGQTASVTPQTDMAEIVAPGAPGGFALAGATESEGVQTTERVEDPTAALGRVDDAYDADATARHERDTAEYEAKVTSLQNESITRDNQARELDRQVRQAEAERAFHQRVYTAIEKTPIDEDEFWSGSPGRAAGAWIALALSGFLQGATRGQNPALNQMVQALNHAQDRYLQNQQKSRDSQLRTRERLIGDSTSALASMKLQLSGIMERRIMLDAQREGLPPPPALATYLAEGQVKRAEAKTAIGQQAVSVSSKQVAQEMKATPATGPLTRFDVELKAMGIPREQHQKAMTDTDLGGRVRSSDELKQIHGALQKIAQASGGELKAQSTLSWTQLGLAPLAARLGIKNAEEQVNTTQLLNAASLAYMGAIGNIKGLDSNVERERFEKVLNSGETQTTLAAIEQRAGFAEQQAVSAASAYAGGNAPRYVDLIRRQLNQPEGGEVVVKQRTGFRAPGAGPTEEQTLQQQAPGGAAPGPLPAAASRPAAQALETSTTGSRPGTYQRLRGSKPSVPR